MAFQILLNALLAFTWMFMNDTYRAADFVSGFALGMIAIFMLRRFFPQRFYGYALYAIFKLIIIFIRELANMITLTPGTLVIDISDDRSILYIHAMDIEDAEKAIHDIRVSFEKAIQEVSGK